MNLQGIQKLTLLDFPGKVACTFFTGGCNLRCPFCHNAGIVEHPGTSLMTETEAYAFLSGRMGILDGVCVTGGEPTLQPDLEVFLSSVKEMGFTVKLDTNGCLPERLRALVEAELVDYVAMDVKNCFSSYSETVGVPNFDPTPVKESLSLLSEDRVDYEFRTTVVRELHTAQGLMELAEDLRGAKRWFLQQFTDSGALLRPGLHAYPPEELKDLLRQVRVTVPTADVRGI